MRVMQINAVAGILSTGRLTNEIAKVLESTGNETSLVYSEGECDLSNKFQMNNKIDKKIHALLTRITGLVGYFSIVETRKLLKYIEEWKPDIVHLHNLHGNYICIPMLLKYLGKKKIATVVTLHDCFFFTGKCCHYTRTGCYLWETVCNHCPRLHKDNPSWFLDRVNKMQRDKEQLFSKIDKLAVIGVSKWVINEAKRSSIFKNISNIQYIYNWIDLEQFKPRKTELKYKLGIETQKVVLSVSAYWDSSKGISDIIEIARSTPEVSFVLVGDFKQEYNFPSNMLTIGKTHDVNELVDYYCMADVFLNLSIEETFGKVTAEALACGTPVVVYNTTACPELVGMNCGKVVEIKDFEGVKRAIEELFNHEKEYYKKACRKFAEQNFDLKKNVQKHIELYGKLLKGLESK